MQRKNELLESIFKFFTDEETFISPDTADFQKSEILRNTLKKVLNVNV